RHSACQRSGDGDAGPAVCRCREKRRRLSHRPRHHHPRSVSAAVGQLRSHAMKMFTKNRAMALGLAAGLAAQIAPAQAQYVQTAVCGSSGCTCKVTRVTVDDVEMTLGVRAIEGASDMILVRDNAGFSWQDLTPAQVDRKYGGTGS